MHELATTRTRSPITTNPLLPEQDTEPVTALAVSPDCKTAVVASRSLTLRSYDLHTGELKRTWRGHKAPVADMAIDASGGWVEGCCDRSFCVVCAMRV